MQVGEVTTHLEHEDRQGQGEPDPEPARHVDKLGVGPGLGAGLDGLQRHAADRAGAGAHLPDLGMHRAGVDGTLGDRLGRRRLRSKVFCGSGDETVAAASRAEIVRPARMDRRVRGRLRIDAHATDNVLDRRRGAGGLQVRLRVPLNRSTAGVLIAGIGLYQLTSRGAHAVGTLKAARGRPVLLSPHVDLSA